MINNTEDAEVEEVVIGNPSLFGMIMNPREQFEKIRENPKIILALAIVTIMTTVGMLLMLSGVDIVDEADFVGMGEEEIMMITLIAQFGFIAVGVFTPPIAILISSIIYIILAKIARSTVTFKQLFSMGTYLFIVSAISLIVNGLAFMAVGSGDPEILFTSLNSVIGADGALGVFLNSIEIFSIWAMFLSALGLQIVARFSKVLSWSLVIGFYVVTTGFSMAMASFTTMLGI